MKKKTLALPLLMAAGLSLPVAMQAQTRAPAPPPAAAPQEPSQLRKDYAAAEALLRQPNRAPALAAFEALIPRARAEGDTLVEASALYNAARALYFLDRHKEALARLVEAAPVAEKSGSKARIGDVQYWTGILHHQLLDHQKALSFYRASLATRQSIKDQRGSANSLTSMGDVLTVLFLRPNAIQAYEISARIRAGLGDAEGEIENQRSIAIMRGGDGDNPGALKAAARWLELARGLKDAREEGAALSQIGLTHGVAGDLVQSADFYRQAFAVWKTVGDRPRLAEAAVDLGGALVGVFEFETAFETLREGAALYRAEGDAAGEARALGELADAHLKCGESALASKAAGEAVALARSLKDPGPLPRALIRQGETLRAEGRYAQAATVFNEGLTVAKAVKSPFDQARALNGLAETQLVTGASREALALYGEMLKVYQAAGVPIGELDARNKMGAALKQLGRYTEALREYDASLALSEQLKLETGKQQTRSNIAAIYAATGRYVEAERLYEEALAYFRSQKNRSGEATILGNLGSIAAMRGDHNRARLRYEESLKILTDLGSVDGKAQSLESIGGVLADTGRGGDALARFNEALTVYRKLGLRSEEARALSRIAAVYRVADKQPEARARYDEALAIHLKTGNRPGEARIRASLASLALAARDYPAAREDYEKALALFRELGEKPSEATVLSNLALVQRGLGDAAAAARTLETAGKMLADLGDKGGQAGALLNLATLDLRAGRVDQAAKRYDEALVIGATLPSPEVTFRAHYGQALIFRERKQWPQVAAALKKSTATIDEIRASLKEQSLQTGFLGQFVLPYHELASALLQSGSPAGAFAAGERARSRALVDLLAQGKAENVQRGLSTEDRTTEAELDGRVSAISAELKEARFLPTDERLQREAELTQARLKHEEFRRVLALRAPADEVRTGRMQPVTLKQVGERLFARQPGLVIASYLVAERETLLFLMSPGKTPAAAPILAVKRIPIRRDALAEQVQQFWNACSQAGSNQRPAGKKLFTTLFGPAAAQLAAAKHLIIVPDGPLQTLPFQALTDTSGRYLVERLPLSYAPSVTALTRLAGGRRRPAGEPAASVSAQAPLLAIGRPSFGEAYSDLPATEKEVAAIGKIFGQQGKVLIGAAANEGAVREQLQNAGIVHFATHGVLNQDTPLYSGLALTRNPGDDGLLEAREIMDLNLRAELVVLSACETALGKQIGGEGTLGLSWAFFAAGAPSIVVSHWQVEDTATGALMTDFHRLMQATGAAAEPNRANALRRAQLKLMKNPARSHPYYWAPFILTGEWRTR